MPFSRDSWPDWHEISSIILKCLRSTTPPGQLVNQTNRYLNAFSGSQTIYLQATSTLPLSTQPKWSHFSLSSSAAPQISLPPPTPSPPTALIDKFFSPLPLPITPDPLSWFLTDLLRRLLVWDYRVRLLDVACRDGLVLLWREGLLGMAGFGETLFCQVQLGVRRSSSEVRLRVSTIWEIVSFYCFSERDSQSTLSNWPSQLQSSFYKSMFGIEFGVVFMLFEREPSMVLICDWDELFGLLFSIRISVAF